MQQPVLQESSVRCVRRADFAALNHRASLLAKRVVAKVVGHSADTFRLFGDLHEHGGLTRIHRERLFAENVFSGAEQFAGLFEMDVVWRTDVNGGDFWIGRKFVERGVRVLEAESLAGFGAALFRAAENAAYGNSQPAQSIHVRSADKSYSDHSRRMLHRSAPGVALTDALTPASL